MKKTILTVNKGSISIVFIWLHFKYSTNFFIVLVITLFLRQIISKEIYSVSGVIFILLIFPFFI